MVSATRRAGGPQESQQEDAPSLGPVDAEREALAAMPDAVAAQMAQQILPRPTAKNFHIRFASMKTAGGEGLFTIESCRNSDGQAGLWLNFDATEALVLRDLFTAWLAER